MNLYHGSNIVIEIPNLKIRAAIFVLFVFNFAFATYGQPQERLEVKSLIELDLKKYKNEIQEASLYLSPTDRESLYNKHKKNAAIAWALLNTIPFVEIGSFMQGDINSGIMLIAVDGTGLLFFVYGANDISTNNGGCSSYSSPNYNLMAVGLSIIIINRIGGWIVPFVYQSKYNKALKEALNINNNISYSIDPLIVPKDGTPAVGLALNLRY